MLSDERVDLDFVAGCNWPYDPEQTDVVVSASASCMLSCWGRTYSNVQKDTFT